MGALNRPDRPKYAQEAKVVPTDDGDIKFGLWHKVVAIQQSKAPNTALAACSVRFDPQGLIYAERTLLDWGDEDDVCECAAAMPTVDQCKAAGKTLRVGNPHAAVGE